MGTDRLMADVCAILTMLLHEDGSPMFGSGCPESAIYLALDADLPRWETVRDILGKRRLITIDHHLVSLTSTGREWAIRIDSAIRST